VAQEVGRGVLTAPLDGLDDGAVRTPRPTTSNTIALAWGSDVGRVYQVQTETNIASANWQSVTGELSATKTNTAIVLPLWSTNNVFYRILEVR
jgi:hypothetical protein